MDLNGISNPDLIRRCRANDARAWREFARRFTRQVYGLSLRMLRDQAEAEDATQETFLRAHRYLDRFDTSRAVEPWLASIGYNVCLRRVPALRAAGAMDSEPDELGDSDGTGDARHVEDGAASSEEAFLLHQCLTQLSAPDRAMLHMHYWQGMGVGEIAEAVEMPANTVKIRLFRARSRLREVLGPQIMGGTPWN